MRKPRFEALEAKQMLAGDVSISFNGGILLVTGDELDNELTIAAAPGGYEISGQGGTTINGQVGPFEVAGDVVHAQILLGDGADTLLAEDFETLGNFWVDTGAGDDQVILGVAPVVGGASISVGGTMFVFARDGANLVTIGDASIGADLQLSGGSDNDTFNLGDFNVGLGAGDRELSVGRSLVAHLGDGALDVLRVGVAEAASLQVLGAGGNDVIAIEESAATSVNVDAGGSMDSFLFDDFTVAGSALLGGGAGDDFYDLTDIDVGRASTLFSGTGDDFVMIDGAVGTNFRIDGQAGDDTFALSNFQIANNLHIVGTSGLDRVTLTNTAVAGLAANWLLVSTGADAIGDQVTLTDVAARTLQLYTGAGEDDVEFTGLDVTSLDTRLGASDDRLEFFGVNNATTTYLDGSTGALDEAFGALAANLGANPRIVGFETVTS